MRLLELLELIQRCINIDAAALNGLPLLVNGRGAGIFDDGGFFRRPLRPRRFPKAKDHGEAGLLLYPCIYMGFKSFVSFPLTEGCLNTETSNDQKPNWTWDLVRFMYFVATAYHHM